MITGSTVSPLGSPFMSMRARALPMTNGFTASRCDGFGRSSTWTRRPSGYARSYDVPRWYLTSPEDDQSPAPASSSLWAVPMNSRKMTSMGLRTTLQSTLSRPRCGMPMMTSDTPQSVAASTMIFMPGIMDSHPSNPKRFAVLNLVARIVSNFSAYAKRSSTCFRSSRLRGALGVSRRLRSQFCLFRSVMCSASMPKVPQYVSWRKSASSRNVVMPSSLTSALPSRPATADPVAVVRRSSRS
mmetsp:Transcript_31414/g.106484  ORF Transcript_31414/g.106484 Transcript_31414/m.106484 type:complete len:242 (-) Transcript_31414:490-1215(-)